MFCRQMHVDFPYDTLPAFNMRCLHNALCIWDISGYQILSGSFVTMLRGVLSIMTDTGCTGYNTMIPPSDPVLSRVAVFRELSMTNAEVVRGGVLTIERISDYNEWVMRQCLRAFQQTLYAIAWKRNELMKTSLHSRETVVKDEDFQEFCHECHRLLLRHIMAGFGSLAIDKSEALDTHDGCGLFVWPLIFAAEPVTVQCMLLTDALNSCALRRALETDIDERVYVGYPEFDIPLHCFGVQVAFSRFYLDGLQRRVITRGLFFETQMMNMTCRRISCVVDVEETLEYVVRPKLELDVPDLFAVCVTNTDCCSNLCKHEARLFAGMARLKREISVLPLTDCSRCPMVAEFRLAVMMAFHSRLGTFAILGQVPFEIVREILLSLTFSEQHANLAHCLFYT